MNTIKILSIEKYREILLNHRGITSFLELIQLYQNKHFAFSISFEFPYFEFIMYVYLLFQRNKQFIIVSKESYFYGLINQLSSYKYSNMTHQLENPLGYDIIFITPNNLFRLSGIYKQYFQDTPISLLFYNQPFEYDAYVELLLIQLRSNINIRIYYMVYQTDNIDEIGNWMGNTISIDLNLFFNAKLIDGGNDNVPFKYENSLNIYLPSLLDNRQESTIILCSTRISAYKSAEYLLKHYKKSMQSYEKNNLIFAHPLLNDLQKYKIGFYHAGLTESDQRHIEYLFKQGSILTLCATTLFINNITPTKLIIKSTKHYGIDGYTELHLNDISFITSKSKEVVIITGSNYMMMYDLFINANYKQISSINTAIHEFLLVTISDYSKIDKKIYKSHLFEKYNSTFNQKKEKIFLETAISNLVNNKFLIKINKNAYKISELIGIYDKHRINYDTMLRLIKMKDTNITHILNDFVKEFINIKFEKGEKKIYRKIIKKIRCKYQWEKIYAILWCYIHGIKISNNMDVITTTMSNIECALDIHSNNPALLSKLLILKSYLSSPTKEIDNILNIDFLLPILKPPLLLKQYEKDSMSYNILLGKSILKFVYSENKLRIAIKFYTHKFNFSLLIYCKKKVIYLRSNVQNDDIINSENEVDIYFVCMDNFEDSFIGYFNFNTEIYGLNKEYYISQRMENIWDIN
ncbi:putative ATP-dependent DNA helicase HFM1 [Astathelohania contejeani]|uniref:ATP-dependent DNA helicase HFM1 n=1 Tax=Astathelohania contejeani TaxID=164912 RepID=A0ABQ7I071_9MICR|nr:putative ATP-dependent DNA helicase HFM1 [Thelohania contejeani]